MPKTTSSPSTNASDQNDGLSRHIRSANFFEDLPEIANIEDVTDQNVYHPAPQDWHIALGDVRNSTTNINLGKYKEINAVAAASITVLINNIPDVDIPFVFGGDGAAALVPPSALSAARSGLIAVQRLAKDQFELDLRIGIVPISVVRDAGFEVLVTKLRVSENFQQAIFTGGGVSHAEYLLKDPEAGVPYRIVDDGGEHEGDFTGFECRWSNIPAQHDEAISLIVAATTNDTLVNNNTFREIIKMIKIIYGNEQQRHPFNLKRMTVSLNPASYMAETVFRQGTKNFFRRISLMLYSIAGLVLWKYRSKIWNRYKQVVASSTDHEKFDDVLRMVISGTQEQRERLVEYLEIKRKQGFVVYGYSTSRHSLMTCLVFDRFGRQVHFVDGSEGGYSRAATMMKAQIAERSG